MQIDRIRPIFFWDTVANAASREADRSPLPGINNGPADAYRHIVGTAELRRRYGVAVAWLIVTANEVRGTHINDNLADTREMDDHNNAVGLRIGAGARTFEDVVRSARQAVDHALTDGGDTAENVARWLPERRWNERGRATNFEMPLTLPVTWPDEIPSAAAYPYGAERFRFDGGEATPREREAATLARLEATPVAEWSEEDVRAVIRSRPYQNSNVAGSAAWRERVRQSFAARDGAAEGDTCGGPTAVRAHTRQTPHGPVTVSAHTRMVTCD